MPPSGDEALYDIIHRRLYRRRILHRDPSRCTLAYSHGFLIAAQTTPPSATGEPPTHAVDIIMRDLLTGVETALPSVPKFCSVPFGRAILSASPLAPGGATVVLFQRREAPFLYCRLGDGDGANSWQQGSLDGHTTMDDMLFLNGKLYALLVQKENNLAAIDLHPRLNISILNNAGGAPARAAYYVPRWMLAEAGGELLLVYHHCNDSFSIWRWDGGTWQKARSLGGAALFLGRGEFSSSMAALGAASKVRANSVYSTSFCRVGWHEYGVESRERQLAVESGELLDGAQSGCYRGPLWVFPSMYS